MHGFLYSYNDYHKLLAERTNEYMKSKGLDITLVTNFETPDTSRGEPNYVANYVEDLLQKEERGYDLYLTDTVYTGRFSKYFEDISKYVDPKVIELYKEGTATNTCIVDTRLVGLVSILILIYKILLLIYETFKFIIIIIYIYKY